MRVADIPVITDTPRYQRLLHEHANNSKLGNWDGAHQPPVGEGFTVVTGDKTADYGGGPSPYGFLLDGNDITLGRVLLSGPGALRLKRRH